MDSGSGSLQSSSGADEEYDSHHHQQQHQAPLFPPPSIFFNPNIPPPSIPPPPPPAHHHHQQQQFPFHLSHHNYQQPSSTNLLYDFPSDDFNLQQPPSNFNPSDSSFLKYPTSLRSDDHHHHQPTQNPTTPTPPTNPSPSSINLHPKSTAKKRTRASRRAPTTVLTTDTTNFRAMVQEFTGIPSPPFTATGSTSSSASSYSRRFDLFGSGSGLGLYNPSRSTTKVVQVMNTNNNNVVVESMEDENALRNFSFHESAVVTESTHLEPRSQQLLSVLQNDITAWRSSGNDADTTAQTAAAAAARSIINYNNAAPNCKFNFTDSSSSSNLLQLQRDHKDILLGNIVVSTTTTTRGETTVVNSWIYPSD